MTSSAPDSHNNDAALIGQRPLKSRPARPGRPEQAAPTGVKTTLQSARQLVCGSDPTLGHDSLCIVYRTNPYVAGGLTMQTRATHNEPLSVTSEDVGQR